MRKYVYLFELDSVRKTDAEIIDGQRALYNEIVGNGNTVVLTYNQLIDSRAFFSLFGNKDYYESIITLFEKGYICISQFGTLRTVAQYLLNTVESEDNRFMYSALPIKCSQRRLVELIKRSVTYSDLSEINEYMQNIGRTDEELKDLFIEVENYYADGTEKLIERPSQLSLSDMKNVLNNLYWMLKTILRLSTLHNIFIPPRDASEYSDYKLKNYLEYICSVPLETDKDTLWNESVNILKHLKCRGSDNRSIYLRELKKLSEKGVNRQALQYAEAIVNLCTNYACEMSICNISKHYNAEDITEKVSAESGFFKDFRSRLKLYWNFGNDAENRFLQDETNTFAEFTDIKKIPPFEEAARIVPKTKNSESPEAPLYRYEFNLRAQQRAQKLSLLKKVPGQIASLLFACIIVMLLNILIEMLHNLCTGEFSSLISFTSFLGFGIETIAFFVIGEAITTVISNKFPKLLSLTEACRGLVRVLKSACHVLFGKSDTYVSEYEVNSTEKRSRAVPIDFTEPAELKRYVRFYNNEFFSIAGSSEYPIADVTDRALLKAIVRDRELYNRKYGIVYNGAFNTMVVDPVKSERGFFPYERVIPSSMKNGVVLFTVCNGKIILLRQFRHAIGKEQLCFPRGFGEPEISEAENAEKELREELNAVVTEKPIRLGNVTPDSGLSSGSATVFLMKIKNYETLKKEGIRGVVEITHDEMRQMVENGEIDDGYTLAALALYSAYTSALRNNL